MTSFSKNSHSYQHSVRVSQSEDAISANNSDTQLAPPRYNLRTLLVATFACGLVGSVTFLSSSGSRNPSSSSSSRQDDRLATTETTGLWGSSSHKKGHHHEKKHKHHLHGDDSSKYKVYPGLRLEGYPSLEIQEQYMRDLQEIDWDAVEADLEALMTQSQDCKGNLVLSSFYVAGYFREILMLSFLTHTSYIVFQLTMLSY